MKTNDQQCAWCDSEIEQTEDETTQPWFCPDCNRTYEAETGHALHDHGLRHPHNN
jgi:hypothetical protein